MTRHQYSSFSCVINSALASISDTIIVFFIAIASIIPIGKPSHKETKVKASQALRSSGMSVLKPKNDTWLEISSSRTEFF